MNVIAGLVPAAQVTIAVCFVLLLLFGFNWIA